MNIFVTNTNPVLAAQDLDDKRLKHMPKECMEMLASALFNRTGTWFIPFPYWKPEDRKFDRLYYHPCSKWVRYKKSHVYWLLLYTIACFDEQDYRFGKYTEEFNDFLLIREELLNSYNFYNESQPEKFQNSSLFKSWNNVIHAYRKTMMEKWFVTDKKSNTWTFRGMPEWTKDYKYAGNQLIL